MTFPFHLCYHDSDEIKVMLQSDAGNKGLISHPQTSWRNIIFILCTPGLASFAALKKGEFHVV